MLENCMELFMFFIIVNEIMKRGCLFLKSLLFKWGEACVYRMVLAFVKDREYVVCLGDGGG